MSRARSACRPLRIVTRSLGYVLDHKLRLDATVTGVPSALSRQRIGVAVVARRRKLHALASVATPISKIGEALVVAELLIQLCAG